MDRGVREINTARDQEDAHRPIDANDLDMLVDLSTQKNDLAISIVSSHKLRCVHLDKTLLLGDRRLRARPLIDPARLPAA
jgi:hypothetical protein